MHYANEIDKEKFSTLLEVNNLINSNYTDLRVLLTRILESAMRLTEGEASSLLMVDKSQNKLYFEIALGEKGPQVENFTIEIGEGIAGWVAKNNRSLIVNNTKEDPRHFSGIDKDTGYPTERILAVPMRIKDNCVGVIEILNKRNNLNFNDNDLNWLEIFSNQAAIAIQNAENYKKISDELYFLKDKVETNNFKPLIGNSESLKKMLSTINKVAVSDSSVLISGESGSGKELCAEQLHLNSKRFDKPLIKINCAAIPENLIESELFGHVKGAFTDANSDRQGRFELADKGTLFLDEIAEVPIQTQGKLLRAIEKKSFEAVGSSITKVVDVRIIAATNKNLLSMVEEGLFRKDLYYRLTIFPILVPPLRDRTEDILPLSKFFIEKYASLLNIKAPELSKNVKSFMLQYEWPGNIRELENTMERALVLSESKTITFDHLMLKNNKTDISTQNLKIAVNNFKKSYIQKMLISYNGNQTKASSALGIQRTYLSRLIKDLDIKIQQE